MPEFVDGDLDDVVRRFAEKVQIDIQEIGPDKEPFSKALGEQFAQLAALPQNAAEGGFSIRLGKRHIKLKKALWDTAVTGALAAVSALDPTGITKLAAAGKVLEYLVKFKGFIETLMPAEIYVYDTVVSATESVHDSGRTLRSEYPSQTDVEALIRSRQEQVPANLKDILGELVRKGGLEIVFERDDVTRYKRVV